MALDEDILYAFERVYFGVDVGEFPLWGTFEEGWLEIRFRVVNYDAER